MKNLNVQKILRIIGVLITIFVLVVSIFALIIGSRVGNGVSEKENTVAYEFVKNDKKPCLVMFHAPWCSFCKKFMPKFEELSQIYKGKYNFVLIDGDNPKNASIIQEYAVGAFPTIYIIDPSLDNRIYINATLYGDLDKVKIEMDRYLRIRSMINVKK